MKLRLTHALAVLALVAFIAPLANAAQVYVRNRPFKEAVVIGGETYVPVDSFLRAAGFTWQAGDGVILIREGKGSAPDLTAASRLSYGGRTLEVETITRGDRLYAPLRSLARGVGFTVNSNNATGIVDVVKGREISESDMSAAAEVEKLRAEKAAAAKAAAEARKKAREEEAKAEEEEAKAKTDGEEIAKTEGEEATEAGDKSEKGEKSTKSSKSSKSAKGEKSAKSEGDVAVTPSATPSPAATPAASPSSAPEAPKEANLVVQNENAAANDYTGVVTVTALVVNQGDATAKSVSARYQLIGPDGKTWESATLYGPNLEPDKSWSISRTYKHPAGASMPRGSLTPKFQLNYQKK